MEYQGTIGLLNLRFFRSSKTTMRRQLSTYIFCVIFAVEAFAVPREGADIIGRFDAAFAALDSAIFGASASRHLLGDTGALGEASPQGTKYAAVSAISPELDRALNELTLARIREGNARTGVQLMGQAYYRPNHDLGMDEEDGVSRYRAKVQAEVRWYLLQSSLFGRKGREREARLREAIARAGYEKEVTDLTDTRFRELLTEHYDSIMAGVLQHRVATLRLLNDAQSYLLEGQRISADEPVRTLDELMKAERKLNAIPGKYPAAQILDGDLRMTVIVDSAALIRHVESTQGDMRLLALRSELLAEQERNIRWWQKWNVAPFARYSFYERPDMPNSSNIDIGLSFTIPLSFETRRKKATLRAEREVLAAERERISRRITDKVALRTAEISRLNLEAEGEARRIASLRDYLQRRGRAYAAGKGEHNRLAQAREYTLYLESLERMIELQYRRDCLVADLQALLPDRSILDFCTVRHEQAPAPTK